MKDRPNTARLSLLQCLGSLVVAALLFGLVFKKPVLGFWLQLALSTAFFAVLAFLFSRRDLFYQFRQCRRRLTGSILIGVVSAAVLYLIFFVGREIVSRLFESGRGMVGDVYVMGEGVKSWQIGLLLLCVIGPCEEIFWRGYVQRRLDDAYGWYGVALTVVAYTLVHVVVGNPVLLLAALVCGAFWSLLLIVFDDIVINTVSHAVWAAAIFAFFPLA